MAVLDWYQWKQGKSPKTCICSQLPKNAAIHWTDLITETEYFLAHGPLEEIQEKGLEVLGRVLEEKGEGAADEFIKILRAVDEDDFWLDRKDQVSLRWLLELPVIQAQGGQGGKAPRLADAVWVAAGLSYALWSDPQEYRSQRLAVLQETLLHGLSLAIRPAWAGEKAPLPEAWTAALAVVGMVPPQALSQEWQERRVILLKGGSVKNKYYILENAKIPDIRGASLLLDEVNRQRIPGFFRRVFQPECLVYHGGGNVLAILPANYQEWAKDLAESTAAAYCERIYEEVTLTAQSIFVEEAYSLAEILGDYQGVMGRLERIRSRRQMTKVIGDSNPELGAMDLEADLAWSVQIDGWRSDGEAKNCSRCGFRVTNMKLSDSGEAVCPSCLQKYRAGQSAHRHLGEEFASYVRKRSEQFPNFQFDKKNTRIDTLEELARRGDGRYIAVIYGDGNNMGKVVQNLQGFAQSRQFSRITEMAAYQVTYQAIAEVVGGQGAVFIALGGDDIFFLTPADKAVALSLRLGELFDEVFYNWTRDRATITMSIGIAISHFNSPVRHLFAVAQKLLKSAKVAAKERESKGLQGGTLDVMALESFHTFETSPDKYRENTYRREGGQVYLTGLPYGFETGRRVLELIHFLQSKAMGMGRKAWYTFRQAALEKTAAEANLFFHYQMARNLKGKAYQEFQRKLCEVANTLDPYAKVVGMYIQKDQKSISLWADVLELWDYANGLNVKEGNQ